jgi:3-methyladenine DNA glycosylase AlkD
LELGGYPNRNNSQFLTCSKLYELNMGVWLMANPTDSSKSAKQIIEELRIMGDPRAVAVMKRIGVETSNYYGVNLTKLRQYAKKFTKSHELALELWGSGIHDARLLATMVEEPKKASEEQIDCWVSEADFWDLTDRICKNIVPGVDFAVKKMREWMSSKEESVRRAGFMTLTELSKKGNELSDLELENYLRLIEKNIQGEANWVKEAMNYCLIAIGGRNKRLNGLALEVARKIGPVAVDYGETSCKVPDAVSYLKKAKIR